MNLVMAVKPAVKDLSIILTNAPQLMLGTKQYPLNFTIMNLRSDVKDISLQFSSGSLKMDKPSLDLTLAPQERKTITLNVSPEKDGGVDLSVIINQKRTIKYTETVLEGHENDAPQDTSPLVATGMGGTSSPSTAPAAQKPAGTPMKPVKPAGAAPPAAVPAMQKPAGTPMKPVKPAGTIPTSTAPADNEALEKRIMGIKDKYMASRTKLQSLAQGTPEYTSTYQDALKYKDQYEKLKSIYESGGTMADAEAAVPSEVTDPIAELKSLGQRYTDLKNKLQALGAGSPDYEKVKQEALAVYKEYNDKKTKAKEQGLAV